MGISVIVPVYNVKTDYIEECINSVLEQTFTDWELIIVDDGSENEFASFLDCFQSDKIKVYHQTNSGVSSARNFGIDISTREFLFFLDPDDWMEKKELETLYYQIEQENSDIVIGNSYVIQGGIVSDGPHRYIDRIIVENEYKNDLVLELLSPKRNQIIEGKNLGGFLRTPWGKLYRRSVIENNGIRFPEDIHPNEDTIFNIRYIGLCNKIVILDDYLHNYRINDKGVTLSYRKTWIENNRNAKKITKEFVSMNYGTNIYVNEWRNYSLLLLKEICKSQIFHTNNTIGIREKKKLTMTTVLEDKDYYEAIMDCCNPLYTFSSKVFAVLVRFGLFRLLNLLYRIK